MLAAESAGITTPAELRSHLLDATRSYLQNDDLLLAGYAAWVMARSGMAVDQHLTAIDYRSEARHVDLLQSTQSR